MIHDCFSQYDAKEDIDARDIPVTCVYQIQQHNEWQNIV